MRNADIAARPRIEYSAGAAAVLARASRRAEGLAEDAAEVAEKPFKWNPGQLPALKMLAGTQRHSLLVGGARSSKTFTFVKSIVNRAIKHPGSRHAILRFRNNAVWSSVGRDTLPKVMRLAFKGVQITGPHDGGYFKLPEYGSEIWLAGLDEKERVEKILGMEFLTIFFNECSQIPYSSVVLALTRLAQKVTGAVQRAYYDLNPTNKRHWTNVLFIQKREPESGKSIENPEDYQYMYLRPQDNAENLPPGYIRSLEQLPARQRRRFLEGIYSDDDDGALWSYEMIEAGRVTKEQVPDLQTIVVSIDPSGAANETETGHDAIGISVFGVGVNGHGYVLEDHTCVDGPRGWGQRAVNAYHQYHADHIVAEVNYGGAMVEYVIKSLDPQVPVRMVTASRGKVVRAEPVSSLYGELVRDEVNGTQRLKNCTVHHVGDFAALEDEMCGFTTLGYIGERSPNRVDALVWAVTDVMLAGNATAWIEHYAKLAEKANAPEIIVENIARRPGGQRPTIAPVENELTELYKRTVRGIVNNDVICAREACGLVVRPGDPKVTDGISVWHRGCH